MIESGDVFRACVFFGGGIVIAGLSITGLRCMKQRRWASLSRNVASIAGVCFVMASVGIRFGEALTWRTPMAALILVLIFTSFLLRRKGYT